MLDGRLLAPGAKLIVSPSDVTTFPSRLRHALSTLGETEGLIGLLSMAGGSGVNLGRGDGRFQPEHGEDGVAGTVVSSLTGLGGWWQGGVCAGNSLCRFCGCDESGEGDRFLDGRRGCDGKGDDE